MYEYWQMISWSDIQVYNVFCDSISLSNMHVYNVFCDNSSWSNIHVYNVICDYLQDAVMINMVCFSPAVLDYLPYQWHRNKI